MQQLFEEYYNGNEIAHHDLSLFFLEYNRMEDNCSLALTKPADRLGKPLRHCSMD